MIQKVFFKASLVGILVVFLVLGYSLGVIIPPRPHDMPVLIEHGMSADGIATLLKEHGVIRLASVFKAIAYIGGLQNKLGAGRFVFEEPMSIFQVLAVLIRGRQEVTIVIPEGFTLEDIAMVFEKKGLGDAGSFLKIARGDFASVYPRGLEGFLFPDTYRFFELASPNEVIKTLLANFKSKTQSLKNDIARSGKDEYALITMASILEKEAAISKDRQIISGILWRRLEEGIPLQVDATLAYTTGKKSHELTVTDLSNEKNLYNTYAHKGLPPGPISNPGLDAIRAALIPEKTTYYYYLSDLAGAMHYAKTFEEHKKNKAKYLR